MYLNKSQKSVFGEEIAEAGNLNFNVLKNSFYRLQADMPALLKKVWWPFIDS